jgi:hypothetical protein
MVRNRSTVFTESEADSLPASGLCTCSGGVVITHLPRSLPPKRAVKSATVFASRYTTSPASGPSVPGLQAHDAPVSHRRCGSSRRSVNGPRSHVRPNSQLSSQVLSMPYARKRSAVHALARSRPALPVSRGPMSSVRWARSRAIGRLSDIPTWRMAAIAFESGVTCRES